MPKPFKAVFEPNTAPQAYLFTPKIKQGFHGTIQHISSLCCVIK